LKQLHACDLAPIDWSRPTWARGLKPGYSSANPYSDVSR
jgi:hypothetical protein